MNKSLLFLLISISLIGCSSTDQDEEAANTNNEDKELNKEITINTGGEDYELKPVYTCNENCTLKDDLEMVHENFNSYGVPQIDTPEKLHINQGDIDVNSSGVIVHYTSTTKQVNLSDDYSLPVTGNKGESSKYIYYKHHNTEDEKVQYDIYAFTVAPN
ncbi:hypothetical protein SAMN05216353_102132 [Halobacillus alkaliphilus]|uniref:Lipoprotein n=1 Tax=Halobacillus alkaliphilus TaxID=396056 RepID=A0A1I2JYV2_9BACI|nr:hypothetical protein [Halobacillus alkaliphilus]SFF57926.1 hypothetical protein SAMN05216353_102132 [Halobacillus alkaliphilus]